MARPIRALLVAGVLAVVVSVGLVVADVVAWFDRGQAVSSASPLRVLEVGGELQQFPDYVPGPQSLLVGVAVALLVGALLLAAGMFRSSSASRPSTASSNAEAHTR